MHTYRITIKLRVKPTIKTKRVAILGAGPGGIVSAKYAVENGFIPVVFDKKSHTRRSMVVWNSHLGWYAHECVTLFSNVL